jgi:ankyrin repeat protein
MTTRSKALIFTRQVFQDYQDTLRPNDPEYNITRDQIKLIDILISDIDPATRLSIELFSCNTDAEIQSLLDQGADPNSVDTEGKCCLYQVKNYGGAKALIKAKAFPALTPQGDNILHRNFSDMKVLYLFLHCFTEVFVPDELLSKEEKEGILTYKINSIHWIDIHARNNRGDNVMYHIVNDDQAVKLLLSNGVSGTVLDFHGRSILPFCTNLKSLELLLQADNKLVNYSKTCLLPWNGVDIDRLKIYLKYGADVKNEGKMCLFYERDIECMKLLISAGADVNVLDAYGKNLLWNCVSYEIIRFYLTVGVNPYCVNNKGVQACSLSNVKEEIKKLLVGD